MKRQAKIMLYTSDAAGIYQAREFADSIDRTKLSGVNADDMAILEEGPDHEHYWDAWSSVCDSAIITDNDGTKYRIHQDGDTWLVEASAESDESSDWYLGYFVDDGIDEEADPDCEHCDGQGTEIECGPQGYQHVKCSHCWNHGEAE